MDKYYKMVQFEERKVLLIANNTLVPQDVFDWADCIFRVEVESLKDPGSEVGTGTCKPSE